MTTNELCALFVANQVPRNYYSFRGMAAGDCYVIEHDSNEWKVYYSERGNRYDEKSYTSEDEACRSMFALVAQMVLSSLHRRIELSS